MKPSIVTSKLRQIASTIENSHKPNRHLVAGDLQRIVAALQFPFQLTPGHIIDSLKLIPDNVGLDDPNFHWWDIVGSYDGQPYNYRVGLEVGGGDADQKYMSGFDFFSDEIGIDASQISEDWEEAIKSTQEYVNFAGTYK